MAAYVEILIGVCLDVVMTRWSVCEYGVSVTADVAISSVGTLAELDVRGVDAAHLGL